MGSMATGAQDSVSRDTVKGMVPGDIFCIVKECFTQGSKVRA